MRIQSKSLRLCKLNAGACLVDVDANGCFDVPEDIGEVLLTIRSEYVQAKAQEIVQPQALTKTSAPIPKTSQPARPLEPAKSPEVPGSPGIPEAPEARDEEPLPAPIAANITHDAAKPTKEQPAPPKEQASLLIEQDAKPAAPKPSDRPRKRPGRRK